MQALLYRWLLVVAIGHAALGIALAFAAHLPITASYFDYLYTSVSNQPPPTEFQGLLQTMVGLFGPTVASWGVLFGLLVYLYREHGHRQIKPVIFLALLVWCLLDSSISLYFGLRWHAYLNAAAALSIAIPLYVLQPKRPTAASSTAHWPVP